MRFLLFLSLFSISLNASSKTELTLKFKMTPAGDFIATTAQVQGTAKMKGTSVVAENIVIPLSTLDAGLSLRTSHMKKKYLEVDKYPTAKLIKGEGANGKGKGVIELRGVQKEIEGTYKIEGNELVADFTFKMNDFKIAKVKYLGVGVNDEVKANVRIPISK